MTEERRIALREALQQIEDADGRVTPELVIQAAQDPQSPLHSEFEWDKAKAAYQHWLDRARQLIRSVTVTVEVLDKSVTVNCYVRDPEREASEQGYRAIMKLREDPEPSRMVLLHEFAQAESHLERAEAIALVVGHSKEAKKALETIRRARTRIENVIHQTA